MSNSSQVIARAREVAESVLFPGALETDSSTLVPIDRLDALAASGLYGLFGPESAGGLDADPLSGAEVIEILAGACLTTAFVWMQHHSAVLAVAGSKSERLRSQWLAPLCSGERRAGVAFAGLRRPGPPILTARRSEDHWILDGSAPWVTGWGRVDVIHTAARDLDGNVVWILVDAAASPSLRAERLELSAVNASATVSVRFVRSAWSRRSIADSGAGSTAESGRDVQPANVSADESTQRSQGRPLDVANSRSTQGRSMVRAAGRATLEACPPSRSSAPAVARPSLRHGRPRDTAASRAVRLLLPIGAGGCGPQN